MKICVLGTGSWGTALSQVLADNQQEVIMWGIDPREVEDIDVNHHNTKFFETEINHNIHASTDLSVVADADVVLAAVPSNKASDYNQCSKRVPSSYTRTFECCDF